MNSRSDLLAEAKEELAIRKRAYPKWVADGRMSQTKADLKIQRMQGIVETLDMLVGFEAISAEMIRKAESQ